MFCRGEFLIGTAGLLRTLQIVSSGFTPPPLKPKEKLETYLIGRFVKHLQKLLDATGHIVQRREESNDVDGYRSTTAEWLIAVRGRMFLMDDSFCVMESDLPYAAIGTGADLALGAFAALYPDLGSMTAHDILYRVMQAATTHNPQIRPPYDFFSLDPKKGKRKA